MKEFNAICIIDDDPITVFGIKKMLNMVITCNNIITYGNGKAAIDGLKKIVENNEAIPDVIFLDINMPIMDGWQFLEEFIAIPMEKKIRINIVTSSIDPLDKEKAEMFKSISHHLIEYNNKPINKNDIEKITQAA